jgi:hypothetical protein
MPVKKVTSVMFGGPNLDILFVTSMAKPPLPRFPGDGVQRGSLFAIHGLGIRGAPGTGFRRLTVCWSFAFHQRARARTLPAVYGLPRRHCFGMASSAKVPRRRRRFCRRGCCRCDRRFVGFKFLVQPVQGTQRHQRSQHQRTDGRDQRPFLSRLDIRHTVLQNRTRPITTCDSDSGGLEAIAVSVRYQAAISRITTAVRA